MADPQVLVVGAGPTGLVLALWLTKAGVAVRIIDKTAGPGTTSRAIVLQARTLEFYRQLGVDRIAIERGIDFKAVNLWIRGGRVGRVPFGNIGEAISPYPYALIFPQDLHEQMLVEQLNLLGVHVERETELVDFTCDGDGVRAELRTKAGEPEVYHAAYLVGCDGAHSTVREKLAVGFPGGTYADTYYVADILGSGPVFDGEMHGALDYADFLAMFPMQGGGRARLVGTVRKKLHHQQDLRWEDVNQSIVRRLKIKVEAVNWFSTYRVHHRVASHFQQGRVFLLGDAAHVHSPVGGQGMNTGIGDAVNLAWKLVAVLRDAAPTSLLETYEPERVAFAQKLVATTDRAFTFVSAHGPLARRVRLRVVPRLLPFLFRFAFFRRLMFRTISQTAIRYPNSPLSQGQVGTVEGGDRLPWVPFKDVTGKMTDNFVPLTSLDWQVHCYGEAAPELKTICETRRLPLHVFSWNSAAAQAGLTQNAAYLVRPDGYIGLVDSGANSANLTAYLERWTG
ncbi:MAG: FAD-dependent monooxygenase [Abitibacteriaceae bacterium]|nr:FAD-dependent monooxygenase [Abditibacteriaceae bacterium]